MRALVGVACGCALLAVAAKARQAVRALRESLAAAEAALAAAEAAAEAERAARCRTEVKLRESSLQRLDTQQGHWVRPIGVVRSVFRECVGTPRQGAMAPATRARVELASNISGEALDGLEAFEYVWVIFVFHLNTNGAQQLKAHSAAAAGQGQGSKAAGRYTFRAKIAPPMLKQRVGLFSTRSPHRPNPIGITLLRVERVCRAGKERHLLCSGVDLADGTPVLDIKVLTIAFSFFNLTRILLTTNPLSRCPLTALLVMLDVKPYVPAYDSFADARVAEWVKLSTAAEAKLRVSWAPEARAALAPLVDGVDGGGGGGQGSKQKKKRRGKGGMAHYASGEAALVEQAIEQTLAVDARSAHKSAKAKEAVQALRFDSLLVKFTWVASSEGGGVATHGADEVRVLSVERDVIT
jgi:tRNA (Thr-GGU) A37 N-methylase